MKIRIKNRVKNREHKPIQILLRMVKQASITINENGSSLKTKVNKTREATQRGYSGVGEHCSQHSGVK